MNISKRVFCVRSEKGRYCTRQVAGKQQGVPRTLPAKTVWLSDRQDHAARRVAGFKTGMGPSCFHQGKLSADRVDQSVLQGGHQVCRSPLVQHGIVSVGYRARAHQGDGAAEA